MTINAIFDAAATLSSIVHLQDKIRRKKEQVQSVTSRSCGNCDHWMKTTCKPEKEHGLTRSMNDFACSDFEMCSSSLKMTQEFNQELGELQASLAAILEEQAQ